MGGSVWFASRHVGSAAGTGALVRVIVGVLVGIVVFGAGVVILRVDEVRSVRQRLLGGSST